MDTRRFDLPEKRGFDVAGEEAYRMAADRLKVATDLQALCRRSGATLENEGGYAAIMLDYLGQRCRVSIPDVEVIAVSGKSLTTRDKLVILHYLNTADGAPPEGRLIAFKELPEGADYYPNFARRAIKPLLDRFADRPEALMAAAEALGGARSDSGDFSFRLDALPRVPLTFILWMGDEELPPEASILFDRCITGYLPTEDITVLCEILAWKLAGAG